MLHSIPVPQEPTNIPYGYCHCGCGQLAPLAANTDERRGHVKGEPLKFVGGHNQIKMSIRERFNAKVLRSGEDGCWIWQGSYRGRYGRLQWAGKHIKAHRLSWVLTYGEIPDDLWVLHKCDNPKCVRPDHLFLGTHQDNMADATLKGRMRNRKRPTNYTNYNSKKTHCPRGHPLSGDNVYFAKSGQRVCRQCRKIYTRDYAQRQRALGKKRPSRAKEAINE